MQPRVQCAGVLYELQALQLSMPAHTNTTSSNPCDMYALTDLLMCNCVVHCAVCLCGNARTDVAPWFRERQQQ